MPERTGRTPTGARLQDFQHPSWAWDINKTNKYPCQSAVEAA